MEPAATQGAGAVMERGERRARKQRVLTQGAPSVTRTIADAIVLKDGDLFLITEPDGRVPDGGEHGLGLYYHDCRFLRAYQFRVDGALPVALGATSVAGDRGLVQLTNPELRGEGAHEIPRETLGIEWSRSLDGDRLTLTDTITFRNWGHTPLELAVEFTFGAGFEDVFEIRGLLPGQLGHQERPAWRDGTLHFLYHGVDGIDRTLTVTPPGELSPGDGTTAHGTVRVDPRRDRRIRLQLQVAESARDPKASPAGAALAGPPAASRGAPGSPRGGTRSPWPGGIASLTTDSLALQEMLHRSFADLELLRTTLRGSTFIAAGIPWFVTLFGRDSLIASLQLLPYSPGIAAETLRLLAELQADHLDKWRDAAPGKILHELRVGEMARSGEIPHTPYYGSVDATPLFLLVLARYVAWTGDLGLFDDLRDHVRRALDWIDHYGDRDGDGYVEYQSDSEHGLINQGWKDSGDAMVDEDGRIATPPIALVEVQAYVYAAKRGVAPLYRARGDSATADRLEREAAELRARFNRDFWVESLGFYAMALEAGKKPLRVVSSNPGHALWCGIADADKAAVVAERIMRGDMYSGWGIRTLSDQSCGYTPIGYHLGTVWPHDNALVAAGLKRYGFVGHARRIFDGIAAAAMNFEHYRLPELFTGFSRARYGAPIRYPVACHPQAWAAGSLPFLLAQLLGLEPDASARRLTVREPRLPGFAERVELHGLRVGRASVDLRFDRDLEHKQAPAAVRVLAVRGELEVSVERSAAAAEHPAG